nr:hypothetical protein BaRGS_018780 [Batillaria attramentaria]
MTTGLIRASASVKWQTPGEESTQCQCTAETIHRSVSAILLHPHHDFADVATAEASRLSLDGPSLCNGPLPLANAPVLSVGTSPPCDSIPIPPVTLPEQACFYLPHDEDVSSR